MKKIIPFLFFIGFIACRKTDVANPAANIGLKVPSLVTYPATDLSLFSVTLSGKIIDTGGSRLIEQGLVVDTFPLPTTLRNVNKFVRQPNVNGEFSTIVISVPPNKTWYVRAYGINTQGTGYGNEVNFSSLQEKAYTGDVILTNQQEVINFGANNYTTIHGAIRISGPVTDLSPLRSLVIIDLRLSVINTQLIDFNGLDNLEVIGNAFPHGFRVERNSLLRNFLGLGRLKMVLGDFYILDNDALVNCSGLQSFTTTGYFEFRIEGCDNLTSIDGLEKMQLVLGRIRVQFNPLLNNLRAWSNLSFVAEDLRIIGNPSLQNLNGLEKILALEGIELTDNPALSDISGLRNIQNIKFIGIINCDAVTDLSAFQNVTSLENLHVLNNNSIINLDGFRNVRIVMYYLSIDNNIALQTLQGLNRVKSVGRLHVVANIALQNLSGLDSLATISGNPISISIGQNNLLQNLDALKLLTRADGIIGISGNPLLTNFCGLKPLFLSGFSNSFTVQNNGSNPTPAQIISTCP